MNLKTYKAVMLLATVLVTAVVWLAFLTAPYVGSAFLMITDSLGSEYPVLMGDVAMPLLRMGTEDPCPQSVNVGWAVAVWAMLLLGPSLAWVVAIRAENLAECAGRWALGLVVWGAVCGLVIVTCTAGIAVALACM